jgi:UDP-N-acetylglucosamine 2-epimerase
VGDDRMKKIVFITGTRADYGKIKSVIKMLDNSNTFDYIKKKYNINFENYAIMILIILKKSIILILKIMLL